MRWFKRSVFVNIFVAHNCDNGSVTEYGKSHIQISKIFNFMKRFLKKFKVSKYKINVYTALTKQLKSLWIVMNGI